MEFKKMDLLHFWCILNLILLLVQPVKIKFELDQRFFEFHFSKIKCRSTRCAINARLCDIKQVIQFLFLDCKNQFGFFVTSTRPLRNNVKITKKCHIFCKQNEKTNKKTNNMIMHIQSLAPADFSGAVFTLALYFSGFFTV